MNSSRFPVKLHKRLKRNRIHFNTISRLFLLVALISLLSCQSDDKFTGVAAGASGRYVVTAYIVSGDTLFSIRPGSTGYTPGINKIGVANFTIAIDVTGSDQLTIRTDYWRNGVRSSSSKEVLVRLTGYEYQFSLLETNASLTYEGSVGRFSGLFSERTAGGLLIPLAGFPNNPNPSSQDVVILAQPAK